MDMMQLGHSFLSQAITTHKGLGGHFKVSNINLFKGEVLHVSIKLQISISIPEAFLE